MGGIYPNQWNGCEGLCFLHVEAIGFAFDCEEQDPEPTNYGNKLYNALVEESKSETAELFEILFDTKYFGGSELTSPPVSESAVSSSYLEMNVTYTDAHDGNYNLSCPGTKHQRHCKLWPSIIKYPVQIENSTSAFTVSIGGNRPSGGRSLDAKNSGMNNENLAKFDAANKQQEGYVQRICFSEKSTSLSPSFVTR